MPEEPTKLEIESAPAYDFEFITQTMNLIPILNGTAAVCLGAITDIEIVEDKSVMITLRGGESYNLSPDEMLELEETLKRRIEDNKVRTKEAMKDQAKMQIEIAAEMQGGVQPGGMIINGPQGRRFRQ